MLQSYPNDSHASIEASRWIDLINPTDAEMEAVRREFGVQVPTRDEIEEIESSSRLHLDGKTLYMTAPLIAGTNTDQWRAAPAAFILSSQLCVTVRFSQLDAFDAVMRELRGDTDTSSADILIRLLEEVVDRAADQLERAAASVSKASHAVFFEAHGGRGLSKDTAVLRDVMRQIGQAGDRAAQIRYMFLSIGRMAAYIIDRSEPMLEGAIRERLEAIRHDILSLDEFEVSLSNRIQLVLDAATGFINIEQNDVVKVLTVASVVGVPPVFVVGVYGMNFRHMPELGWAFGYPIALALCVASAVIPWLFFKRRGWL